MLVRRATVADTRRVELMEHLYNQDNQAIEMFLKHGPDVLTPSPLLAWQLALHKQPREPLEEHIWKKKMGALGKDLEDEKKRASDLERQVHLGGLKYTDTAKMLRDGQQQLELGQRKLREDRARLREDRARLNLEAAKAQQKHEQELKALENERGASEVAKRQAERIKAELEAKVAAEEAARQKAETEKRELEAKAAESQRKHTEAMRQRQEKYTQTEEKQRQEQYTQTEEKRRQAKDTQTEDKWREAEEAARQTAEKEKQELEAKAAEYQKSHQEAEAKLERELETTRETLAAEEVARQKAENELATKAAEYKEAEERIERRNQTVTRLRTERDAAKEELQVLDTNITSLNAAIARLSAENTRLIGASQERDELQRKLEANRATLETLETAKRELENKVQASDASLTRVRQEANDCHEQEAALKLHTEQQEQDHKNWTLLGQEITEHTQNDPRAQRALLDLYWRSSVDNPNELLAAFDKWKHEHTPVTPSKVTLTPTMNAESPHPHPAQHIEEKRESSRRLVDDRAASHAETADIARRLKMSNEAYNRRHELQELTSRPIFKSEQQEKSYNNATWKIDALRINQEEKNRLIRQLNYATHYNAHDLESRVWAHITQHELQESERRRQKPNIFREHFYSSSLSSTPELAEVASASLIGRRASTVSDSKRRGDWQGNFSGGDDYLRRLAVQYSKFV